MVNTGTLIQTAVDLSSLEAEDSFPQMIYPIALVSILNVSSSMPAPSNDNESKIIISVKVLLSSSIKDIETPEYNNTPTIPVAAPILISFVCSSDRRYPVNDPPTSGPIRKSNSAAATAPPTKTAADFFLFI